MKTQEEKVIEELVDLVLMQYDEITKLKARIEQIKQYIVVYEDYIERGDC